MINQFVSFFKTIIPFTIGLFLIQYFIVSIYFKNTNFIAPTSAIYIFHFTLTSLVFTLLIISHKKNPDYTGFAFLGGSLFKMIVVIIFIIIATNNDIKIHIQDFISFFIPYFFFLFIETYLAIKLLKNRKK